MLKDVIPLVGGAIATSLATVSEVGAVASIIIGVIAGILTLRFMRLRNKKLRLEIEKLQKEKESFDK